LGTNGDAVRHEAFLRAAHYLPFQPLIDSIIYHNINSLAKVKAYLFKELRCESYDQALRPFARSDGDDAPRPTKPVPCKVE
jgi:hypothetical protein